VCVHVFHVPALLVTVLICSDCWEAVIGRHFFD